MTQSLDGPRAPAKSGAPDALIVLVHGYGANGQDLIPLAGPLSEAIPTAAFAAPDAPLPMSEGLGLPVMATARQWFPLQRIDPAEMEAGVRSAAPSLDAFCDEELARLGVAPERLVLAGFSQGCMMSLHVAPRRTVQPAALVGWSGALCGAQALKAEVVSHPPTLLVHGDQDQVVAPGLMLEAAQGLSAAGIPVSWHFCAGLAHGIGPEAVQLAAEHIAGALADAPASHAP